MTATETTDTVTITAWDLTADLDVAVLVAHRSALEALNPEDDAVFCDTWSGDTLQVEDMTAAQAIAEINRVLHPPIEELAAEHEDTSITLCPAGDHLRVARQIRRYCFRCEQPIPTGDVGPWTWDDEQGCGIGAYPHQHGCGEINMPIEVTVDPGEYSSLVEAVDDAIAQLDRECREESDRLERQTRDELLAELRSARDQLRAGEDYETVRGDPDGWGIVADEEHYDEDEERWVARGVLINQAPHPADDDYVAVTEEEL